MRVVSKLAIVVLAALPAAAPLEATVPAGFSDTLVASVGAPIGLAFLPGGRLLVTTQGGLLLLISGGVLLATPALTIPAAGICTKVERGMLGVTVDPAYPVSPYLYIYYTANTAGGCVNRLSRFTLADGSDIVTPASELILVDDMPSVAGNHNAGDAKFGPDGYPLRLASATAAATTPGTAAATAANDASRDQQTLTGKILRINKDGIDPGRQPVPGRRDRALQRHGADDGREQVPGDLRVGLPQPVPLRVRPERNGHPDLRERRRRRARGRRSTS